MIYYYYNETAPVYLFMAYAKAAQENPSPAAMAILAKLAAAAKAGIKAKKNEKRQWARRTTHSRISTSSLSQA